MNMSLFGSFWIPAIPRPARTCSRTARSPTDLEKLQRHMVLSHPTPSFDDFPTGACHPARHRMHFRLCILQVCWTCNLNCFRATSWKTARAFLMFFFFNFIRESVCMPMVFIYVTILFPETQRYFALGLLAINAVTDQQVQLMVKTENQSWKSPESLHCN